jgi:hypothetical protein
VCVQITKSSALESLINLDKTVSVAGGITANLCVSRNRLPNSWLLLRSMWSRSRSRSGTPEVHSIKQAVNPKTDVSFSPGGYSMPATILVSTSLHGKLSCQERCAAFFGAAFSGWVDLESYRLAFDLPCSPSQHACSATLYLVITVNLFIVQDIRKPGSAISSTWRLLNPKVDRFKTGRAVSVRSMPWPHDSTFNKLNVVCDGQLINSISITLLHH